MADKPKVEEFDRSPRIEAFHLRKLQDSLNERAIVAVAQPKTSTHICAFRFIRGDRLIGCSDLAAYHHVEETPCTECGKTKKHADEPFCLAHMALHVAGAIRNVQTSLDEVDPKTKAAPSRSDVAAGDVPEPDGNGFRERGEAVLDGETGAPVAAAASAGGTETEFPMEPSDEDLNLCVCGWEIASPIPGHDRRHRQYVDSIASETETDTVVTKHVAPASKPKRAGTAKKSPPPARPNRKKRA